MIMIFLALHHKNRKQEITTVFMTKADDDARKNTFSVIFSTLLFCCCSNSNYWCLYWYSPSLHFLFLLLCVASASEVAAAVYAAPHRPVTAVRRSVVACAACLVGVHGVLMRRRGVRRHPAAPATSTFPKGARKQGLWTTTAMQPPQQPSLLASLFQSQCGDIFSKDEHS